MDASKELTELASSLVELHDYPGSRFVVFDSADVVTQQQDGEQLTADRLYLFDKSEVEQSQTAAFIGDCNEAFFQLRKVARSLKEESPFEADIEFMTAKSRIYALARYQPMGEGVTLVVWWLMKIAAAAPVAPDAADHLAALERALQQLKRSPNLDFNSAMEMVDELENLLGPHPTASYAPIAALLLGEEYQNA